MNKTKELIERSYERYLKLVAEINTLHNISALLSWDQQVWMPGSAHSERGEQLSQIAQLAHEKFTCSEMEDMLGELSDSSAILQDDASLNVRETQRLFDREKRLPAKLVAELSEAFSNGYDAWLRAKENVNFDHFAPFLNRNVELQREAAECYGYTGESYDALLEGSEPGMTAGRLQILFDGMKETIVPVLLGLRENDYLSLKKQLNGTYTVNQQKALGSWLLGRVGFNLEAGRIDTAPHPFTTALGTYDVRLTSWHDEHDPFVGIRATMHEAGHGLYRQGLNPRQRGAPLGSIASRGVDEAQARFWENCIGKSRSFWEFFFPEFDAAFPLRDKGLDIDSVLRRVNAVIPGTSRVHADEVTYNLHIILRCEIERDLLRGNLAVKDLPELWDLRMSEEIGVRPANDAEGVLQDPHWSDSMFGYFPTYLLGNVYAAQLYSAIRRDLSDFEHFVRGGDFVPILLWFRDRIYTQGMRYSPEKLIERATGKEPSHHAFAEYLEQKLASIKCS